MKPFSVRNRKFTVQVPGEVILFLLVKLTLLVSLGINLMR